MKRVQTSLSALDGGHSKGVDLAFAELDVIEEMLRPLVVARQLHQREDFEVRFSVTQTKEFQLLGRSLNSALGQLQKQIVSWIGPEAFQRHYIESAMLMAITKIRDCFERLKMAIDAPTLACASEWRPAKVLSGFLRRKTRRGESVFYSL